MLGQHYDFGAALAVVPDGDDYWTDGDTVMDPATGGYRPKIALPKGEGEKRAAYDARFREAVERAFGPGLVEMKLPIDPERVTNHNPIKNRPRYEMYLRMVEAGERLPPAVVRASGTNYKGEQSYYVQDGNHRYYAAQAGGLQEIDALLMPGTFKLGTFGSLRNR